MVANHDQCFLLAHNRTYLKMIYILAFLSLNAEQHGIKIYRNQQHRIFTQGHKLSFISISFCVTF